MADIEAPSHAGRNVVLVIILLAIIAAAVVLTRGGTPAVTAKTWPQAVGQQVTLHLTVRDGMGGRRVRGLYGQGGTKLPSRPAGRGGRHWRIRDISAPPLHNAAIAQAAR